VADPRDIELRAQATRVQQCGPITDYFGCGPLLPERYRFDAEPTRRLALCRCVHGREWVEGGMCGTEGDICKKCSPRAELRKRALWALNSASWIPAGIVTRFDERGRAQQAISVGSLTGRTWFYIPLGRWRERVA
jgi:hypothetical protein